MLLVESAEDVVDEPLGINDDYAVDIGDQRCDKAWAARDSFQVLILNEIPSRKNDELLLQI